MIVKNYMAVHAETVEGEAENTTIRWLIAESEGAPNFYMRLFEIGPDGNTPHHAHEWEHEVFILDGEGKLLGDGISQPLNTGDVVFIPGGEIHHFESANGKTLKMLCLIPAIK